MDRTPSSAPAGTEPPHHPLPASDRARHDQIPESIERERPLGDDDPQPDEESGNRGRQRDQGADTSSSGRR